MPESSPNHEHITYKISYNTPLQNKKQGITNSAKNLLEELCSDIGKGKKSTIKRLQRAIKKYPKVPQFKNYLSKEYLAAGNELMSLEVTNQTLSEHPDYLFGKINKAHAHIERGETFLVPELLGEAMNLQTLYPERDEFHIDEVLNFYSTTVFYFLEVGDREQAVRRLDLLDQLDPEAHATQLARNRLMMYDMTENLHKSDERWAHDAAIEREVKSREYRTSTQTDKAPEFHHQEIDLLYRSSLNIDESAFRALLELPRETLITDLEGIIEDTINRFEFFRNEVKKNGWDETKHNFSIHAVHLLADLGSEESLTAVMELLRQGEQFLDFWYADSLEHFFTDPVAELAIQQFELLDNFLREPGNSYYARNIAVCALEKIALWYPERKAEVVSCYEDWLKFLVDKYPDERIYDTKLLCFIIWSCININAEELLPLIKTLYEQDLVLISMLGEYQQVEEDIKRRSQQTAEPYDLFKTYKQFKKDSQQNSTTFEPVVNPFPKQLNKSFSYAEPENNPWKDVGRNDPCPCGSGRKFKKCCLR